MAQIWTGTNWVFDEPNGKYVVKAVMSPGEQVLLIKDYGQQTRTVGVDNSWESI